MKHLALLAVTLALSSGIDARAGETEWPQFRGPTGQGISEAANVPVKWGAEESVAWKIEVPGKGWSSPILSRGRLYLTSAVGDAATGVTLHAWCLDATDGRGVDLVVDSVGAATWRQSIRSLAVGGRLCVCGATSGDSPEISIRELYQSHRRIIGAPMGGRPDFDAVMALVLAGRLSPVIHATYPLEEVAEAMDLLEAGQQFGKIVIEP